MDVFKGLLEWFSIASPTALSQILVVGLILVTGLVLVRLVRPRRRTAVPSGGPWAEKMTEKVLVRVRPLMNDAEVGLFNLLLLAVRDHFLLLAKVPVRSLVQLRVNDESYKRLLAHTIRNRTVDFVVVHPGTLLPVKAIFIRKSEKNGPDSRAQEHVVDALFRAAGIDVLRLDQDVRYSVEHVTELLGLKEEA